jgi:hypothetical protein
MNIVTTFRFLESAALRFEDPERAVTIVEILRRDELNAEFFFAKLQDQRWLYHLYGRGFFENPPDRRVNADGSVSHPGSPALGALARLASSEQKLAARIYCQVNPKENLLVVEQMLRGIAEISAPELIPPLVPVVGRLLAGFPQAAWRRLDSILRTWHKAGATDCLTAILGIVIDRCLCDRQAGELLQISEIDTETIAPLAKQHPAKVADCLFLGLCRWAAAERHTEPSNGNDARVSRTDYDPDYLLPDAYVLESFKSYPQFEPAPIVVLANRLFQIGTDSFESHDREACARFDSLIRSDRWYIFQRLRWQLYADHPTKSKIWARRDVLERLPHLGSQHFCLNYGFGEWAQMLEAHTQAYGSEFLSPVEVEQFAQAVLSGPKSDAELPVDGALRDRFQRRQLHPIRSLLAGEALQAFERLSAGKPQLTSSDYRRLNASGGRTIEHVAPARANEMESMSDDELWTFLNTWRPSADRRNLEQWWVEEDEGALGFKFAEFLETHPDRFRPDTRWWENLIRPAILQKPLERAVERLGRKPGEKESAPLHPNESEWRNWFGLAEWIVDRGAAASSAANRASGTGVDQQAAWDWPRMTVVRFLMAPIESEFQCPEDLQAKSEALLRRLVEDEDPRLTGMDRPKMSDWLTTAINSVRGTAFEGLLKLGARQKQTNPTSGPDTWILSLIEDSICLSGQSPALFAILGAQVNLAFYLFDKKFSNLATLLLPQDRQDARTAFIVAHFLYHPAAPALIKAIPTLPEAALECLQPILAQDAENLRADGDFAIRLGFHLAFYYWNDSFADEQVANTTLDRFFETAMPTSRGTTIGQIGKIFKSAPPSEEHAQIFKRTMNLWDRRFSRIETLLQSGSQPAETFHEELSEFLRWLPCECFPFEWRADRVMKAIGRLERGPRIYGLVENLEEISSSAERLPAAMKILRAVIERLPEDFRWAYREEHLKPLLRRGMASPDMDIRRITEEIQEALLRCGCFEYLNLD